MLGLLKRINYLITHGLFMREMGSHIKHKREKHEDKLLPEVSLSELIKKVSSIQLLEKEAIDGNVSKEELEAISTITAFRKPKRIFEIGTFDGRTAINLAANAPNAEVFTLDLPQDNIHKTKLRIKTGDKKFIDKPRSGLRFIGTEYEAHITQIYADSATFDSTPYENSIDLIFIDGSHSYEYVKSDTQLALRLLRRGKGTILWHDYGWHEVVKGLNEYYMYDSLFKEIKNIKGTTLAHLHIG